MQLKFLKSNEDNYSYDFFCNTFKRFYIRPIKNRQAIVFLDTFFAPLSLLHSCLRNLYKVIWTLVCVTAATAHTKGPTKTCRSTRAASGAIELLLKAAGTQGAQGTQI